MKHDYYVVVDDNGIQAVKWVHKSKDGYFYKKRVSRRYIDVIAPKKDLYTLDRYYFIISFAQTHMFWLR